MSRNTKWQSVNKRAAKRFAFAGYTLNRKTRKESKNKRKKSHYDKSRNLE